MAIKSGVLLAAAVEVGLIDAATVAELTVRARRERVELIDLVCLHGRFPPASLYQAVAECRKLPFIAAGGCQPDGEAMRKLPASLMQRSHIAPVITAGGALQRAGQGGNQVWLWVADPDNHAALETARRLLGAQVMEAAPRPLAMGEPEAIVSLVDHWLRHHQTIAQTDGAATESADYIGLLDAIFKQAYLARASDIHFEPGRAGVRVRLRVDGRLRDYPRLLTPAEGAGLISRTKVLAGMDIAEAREPQDGGLRHQIGNIAAFDVCRLCRWGTAGHWSHR